MYIQYIETLSGVVCHVIWIICILLHACIESSTCTPRGLSQTRTHPNVCGINLHDNTAFYNLHSSGNRMYNIVVNTHWKGAHVTYCTTFLSP